jgi:hypothetical protein
MNEETDWHPTDRYTAGLGNGTEVERVQLGYAKMEFIENEKLASDLAKLIPVPVPHVEIVRAVRMQGPCAISYVHSSRSRPLAAKDGVSEQVYPLAVRTALKRASGLLPFLAWIAADDHNDDTNLVVEELENDDCRVMAIASRHPIHPRPSGHFAAARAARAAAALGRPPEGAGTRQTPERGARSAAPARCPGSRILSRTSGIRLPACLIVGVSIGACGARTGRARSQSSTTSRPPSPSLRLAA